MENLMLNLLIVSVITGGLALLLKATSGLFKSKYTIALKQLLWVILAIRLLVPLNYSHTLLSVSTTQYKDEGVITFSANAMSQGASNAVTYIAPFDQNANSAASQPADNETTNQVPDKENENDADAEKSLSKIDLADDEKLLANEKEGSLRISMRYLLFNGIRFLQAHQTEILLFYLAGIILFFSCHLAMLLALYIKKHKHSSIIETAHYLQILGEIASSLQIKRTPKLMWMDGINSPMAIGFFRFTILLPKENYTDQELTAIFTHELTHILHQDLRIKMLYLLANGIHWFNPFIYLMVHEACKDMELYCDYSIVETQNREARMNYNELLLQILKNHKQQRGQSLLTTRFKGGVKEMKERFICNLDMRKKKTGILPACLTVIVIILSAGLISLDTLVLDVKASENSFWARHPMPDEGDDWDWRDLEKNILAEKAERKRLEEEGMLPLNPNDTSIYQYTLRAGDPSLPFKPRLNENNEWQIPAHFNDDMGNVIVEYVTFTKTGSYFGPDAATPVFTDNGYQVREPLPAPPSIVIYNESTKIPSYGLTVGSGWTQDSDSIKNLDFFKEQAPKEQENPLFYVDDWRFGVSDLALYFPDGQEPDSVDVEDIVLTESGDIRYPDSAFKVIYRMAFIDSSTSSITFSLTDHYAISESEPWISYEDLVHPYNRGFRVNCYWNTTQGLYSCTYSFIVRTQTTDYDEQLGLSNETTTK